MFSILGLVAVACGGAGDDSGDDDDVTVGESNGARVTPGAFELDVTPHGVATACDVHTHLVLASEPTSTATLSEIVGGMCRLALDPNVRSYRLRLAKTECGSRHYTGSVHDERGTRAIAIDDHRARTCDDVVPAQIVVTETLPGAAATTKFARDPLLAAGAPVTVSGTLVNARDTGASIQTKNQGTLELLLDPNEQNLFADGKTARVKGAVKYDAQNHEAIDVTEILLCPAQAQIDCTPSPYARLSNYCSTENRAWVKKSCPGVAFVD
ncbi:MAG TPA: hypothetical protein VIF62_20940 [Labilithrix sp.]